MCFFSVIIPVYNSEQFLMNSLNSLINQNFKDFEAIMINDGSTDRSEEICRSYVIKDARFILINQINSGVSKARNVGIDKSKGKYIVFLDSDDQYEQDYLKAFYEIINKYPLYDNYWCGFNIIRNKKSIKNTVLNSEEVTINSKKNIMALHSQWMDSTLWNKAFKSEIIKQFHISMKEDISLGEDMLFNYEYLDHCNSKIVIINKYLYKYMQFNSNSLDTKYREDLKDIYDYLDNIILAYLIKWKVNKNEITQYYNAVFYSQEKILKNTFSNESRLTLLEKYHYNNMILKSDKFKKCLEQSDCFIHPLYRKAYMKENYFFVQLIDKLVNLKNGK